MLKRSLRLVNLLPSGDFEGSTAGWTLAGGIVSAELSYAGSKSLKFINNGDSSAAINIPIPDGHKAYCAAFCNIIAHTAGITKITTYDYGTWTNAKNGNALNYTTLNTWQKNSLIRSVTGQGLKFTFNHGGATALTDYWDCAKVVDLNDFLPADILALSDADLKMWCDNNIPAWFNIAAKSGGLGGLN